MDESTDMDVDEPTQQNQRQLQVPEKGCDPDAAEKNRSTSSAYPYVSFDVLFLILLKLPDKTLARFKCVSKDFKAVIADQNFISLRRPPLIIQTMMFNLGFRHYYKYYQISYREVKEITIEMPEDMRSDPYLICSCHGLLCFLSYRGIYVYNSVTKIWICVPQVETGGKRFCVLYHKRSTDTYHLLTYVSPFRNDPIPFPFQFQFQGYDPFRIEFQGYKVHELGSASWRAVSETRYPYVPLKCRQSEAVAIFGCLYWICTSIGKEDDRVILEFDVETEKFSYIREPPVGVLANSNQDALTLIETDAGLGYPTFTAYTMDLWVRQGRDSPWTKQYVIDLKPLLGSWRVNPSLPLFTALLSTAGEIWFLNKCHDDHDKVTIYNCNSRKFRFVDLRNSIPECYTGRFNYTFCHWESAISLNAF